MIKIIKYLASVLSFVFLNILSGTLSAQEYTFPELNGYKLNTNFPVYTPDDLWDYIDGAADAYLAFGFIDLHIAEYTKGKNIIKVEIYRHPDNVRAFGIFSTERFPSYKFIDIGVQGYNTEGQTFFLKGNYYVKVMTNSKSPKTLKSVEPLAYKIAEVLNGEITFPALLKSFPEEGRKVNEETFLQDNVLGHSFLTESFKANYEYEGNEFSVFLMEKKSVEESRKTVNDYLTSLKMDVEDQNSGKYVLQDGYNGTIFLSWNDKMIVLISGLAKDQTSIADKYSSLILK